MAGVFAFEQRQEIVIIAAAAAVGEVTTHTVLRVVIITRQRVGTVAGYERLSATHCKVTMFTLCFYGKESEEFVGITLLQDILRTYIHAVHFALSFLPDDDVSSAPGNRPARDFICIFREGEE